MIEPSDGVFDCLNRSSIRLRRPAQHDDVNAACARRGDLAVGCRTAAVLRDHHVDAMLGHQRAVVSFAERAAAGDVVDASLTSVHRSPETAIHGGRRSATNGTLVWRAAATAFAEITLA